MTTCDMRYWRVAPDPRLRSVVACYWAVDTDRIDARIRAHEPCEDLLIPDGFSEIVFNRGCAGFDRWPLGARNRNQFMGRSYVIGGRSHSINTRAEEPLRLAGVKLDSRFLRAIIRTPLSEFRDATLALADLGDAPLLALEDAVGNARCLDAIIGLLNDFFLAALRDLRNHRSAVDALVERIQRDGGTTPIMGWARQAGVDPRSLERSFCASIGMSPKQFARVLRFKKHYQALISAAHRPKTLSANLEGYYDQSHFNREFRHFTGVAPGAKLAGRMTQGMKVTDHLLHLR
jgi:AraC-like DNA-binding protein